MVLFQTHNWEKSSFFSTLVHVFALLYAKCDRGGIMCPPGPNRVKERTEV